MDNSLISRQAAIDALCKRCDLVNDDTCGDQIFRCPECGYTCSQKLLEGWGTSLNRLYLPHCPNCGAYMRGESE